MYLVQNHRRLETRIALPNLPQGMWLSDLFMRLLMYYSQI